MWRSLVSRILFTTATYLSAPRQSFWPAVRSLHPDDGNWITDEECRAVLEAVPTHFTDRTDNFNRTNSASTLNPPSDAGSNYTVGGGTWGIGSNQGYNPASATPAAAVLDSGTSDTSIQLTVVVTDDVSDKVGLCARYSDISNHWAFYQDKAANKTRLYKIVATSFVQVIDNAAAPVNGDVLKLTFSGNTWTAYINGAQVGTGTDSFNSTATKHGLWAYTGSPSLRLDNFSITSGAVSPTLSSPAVPSAGTTLTATLSQSGCIPTSGTGGFTLSGTSATVSSWAISGTTLTLTLSGKVLSGQTVTYSYDRATTTDDISESTGVAFLANFSGVSVTNNSTQTQSFTVSPSHIPKNHAGNITLTLAGTSTTWAGGGSEFALSGVTGVTKISENVTSATAATIVVTTDATHTGTLSITDLDSIVGTTTVATATLVISPTSGAPSTTPTLTLTGTNTVWTQQTAAGLFTVSGGTGSSIGTPTITTDTAGTVVLTDGSAAATLTITDTSTGATATFSVTRTTPANYYVRLDGNDSNAGTADTSGGAWLTVSKATTGPAGGYIAGDTLTFDGAAGVTFSGNLTWSTSGTQAARCVISGTNGAVISPGTGTGVYVLDAEFVTVQNLGVTGPGVNSGTGVTTSTGYGILFFDDRTAGSQWRDSRVINCTITGTQSGIGFKTPTPDTSPASVVGFEGVSVISCTVHDCQANAVIILGGTVWLQAPPYYTTTNVGVFKGVYIGYCTVYNIFGSSGVYDRTMWLIGCLGGLVERCVVYNCGQRQSGVSDNAQIMWEVSSYCVIQFCECYGNFNGSVIDIDLNTDHCTIQYCYTHENDGAGLMDFGSGSGTTNVIRYCVSRNDTGSQDGASMRLGNAGQYYGNTIISSTSVSSFPCVSIQGNANLWNNILVGNGGLKLIQIDSGTPSIVGNLYYTGNPTTANFDGSITTLAAWRSAGHEKVSNRTFGVIGDPLLSNPTAGANTGTLPGTQLCKITYYDPSGSSPALGAGVPPELLEFVPGPIDFHGYPNRTGYTIDIGAVAYGAVSLADIPAGGGGGAIVGSAIIVPAPVGG